MCAAGGPHPQGGNAVGWSVCLPGARAPPLTGGKRDSPRRQGHLGLSHLGGAALSSVQVACTRATAVEVWLHSLPGVALHPPLGSPYRCHRPAPMTVPGFRRCALRSRRTWRSAQGVRVPGEPLPSGSTSLSVAEPAPLDEAVLPA